MSPPEVNLGWGDPPPDPKEPGGPEPGEIKYDSSSAAASGGHNWILTALGAVGKFLSFLLRHWRWDSLAIVLGIAYGAYLTTGDRSLLLWRVAGIGFAFWFIACLWAIPEPKTPIPVTPPPGTGWSPDGDGGQEILAEMATKNAERSTFWSPLRPVFRTSKERLVRSLKKAGKFLQAAWATVWAWLVTAGKFVAAVVTFLAVGAWEIGRVIFTKPIDRSRPWDKRKPSWVVIGVLVALIPFSVLVGMNLPRAGSAGKEMLAGMSQFSLPVLPKLPEFRWPTWGATPSQMAANPSAQPAPTVKPPLPPTAFGNGFRRKPDPEPETPPVAMAAAPLPVTTPGARHGVKSPFSPPAKMGNDPTAAPRPLRSVKAVDKAVRQVETEADQLARDVAREKAGEQFRRERKAALKKAEEEEARKATEAKANAATRQRTAEARRATPVPMPTVLVAIQPPLRGVKSQFSPAAKMGNDPVAKLRAELARAQKERDEAQAKAAELAARPVPTPVTITRTVSVPGPARTVYRDRKIAGPVRVVRQTVEVKVPVVKTVTKTKTVVRTKIVRVPGPTRTRVIERPVIRTITQTRTVKIPVQGPERVVYRDRVVAPPASTGTVRGTSATSRPKRTAKKAAMVAKTQQPAAPRTTTAGADPYGGDPYDY